MKTQQRFKKRHEFFTEEIDKIALRSSDGKRMSSIDSIEIYAHETIKDLVSEKEEIKSNNKMIKKMINFDDVTKENITKHNPNWPQIPNHPYRILIIGSSGPGRTNLLFDLISQQPGIN